MKYSKCKADDANCTATNTEKTVKGQALCLVLWQETGVYAFLISSERSEQMWMGCWDWQIFPVSSCLFCGICDPRDSLREQNLDFSKAEMGKRGGPLYLPFKVVMANLSCLPTIWLKNAVSLQTRCIFIFLFTAKIVYFLWIFPIINVSQCFELFRQIRISKQVAKKGNNS